MRIRSHFKNLEVNIEANSTPSIHGDGVRIAQVFENLFTNAIKYAPTAPITVTLASKGETVMVVFKDGGPGIAPESLPLIFERFYRVKSEKSVTGSGLGLYICKQIIMAHHGNIWVESTLDRGTTFFIEFPADPVV